MTRLSIRHTTRYAYSQVLRHAVQELRLTPRSSAHQTVESWTLSAIGPLFELRDAWGNTMHSATLAAPTASTQVVAAGVVRTHPDPCIIDEPQAPSPYLYLRDDPLTQPHPRLAAFARPHLDGGVNEASVLALARAVGERVQYRSGHTDVETTALEAFDWGRGVCQDQAHVLIAACRSCGVPARYVSGYFHAPDAPDLASHAWVDVCLDLAAARWVSVDVTHACLMDERHVRLAVGPDYDACPPIRGVREGGGEERMTVDVSVERLPELE